MTIAIITGGAVNHRHGSGVQIARLFEGMKPEPWHLFWETNCGDDSGFQRAYLLKTLPRLKRLGSLASPPAADSGVLRMVMLDSLGSADNPALSVLADALPVLRARWPKCECLYMGQHYHMLPDRLRPLVTYPGRISLETFEQLLSTAHVAFLPSPQRLDCYGRFSPVARLTDYFAAGLPVLYCVAKGSVAEQLLTPLSPLAAARADTPESLVAAVERFAEPVQWREASRLLRSHAEEHFAIGRLREKVLGALATTCDAATARERKDCHAVG